jgi:lipopolysaccharide transport system ATP-binding protein
MYVRLAFAVAAHLDPDIVVVDEVLAVGDAEFQKKCLGKMGEVARGGRTVLFVSHNMTAVQSLCDRAMLMQHGQLSAVGSTADIVARYLDTGESVVNGDLRGLRRHGEGNIRFHQIEFLDRNGLRLTSAITGEEVIIAIEFDGARTERRPARLGITFYDAWETALFICANEASRSEDLQIAAGDKLVCRIPRLPLSAGRYRVGLFLERSGIVEDWLQDLVPFDVSHGSFFGTARNTPVGWEGKTVLVKHEWRRLDDPSLSVSKRNSREEVT